MTPILVWLHAYVSISLCLSLLPPIKQGGTPSTTPHSLTFLLPFSARLRWFRPPAVPCTVQSTRRPCLQLGLAVKLVACCFLLLLLSSPSGQCKFGAESPTSEAEKCAEGKEGRWVEMERYEVIKDIGSGNFGVAKLVRDVRTKELFAVKFIERGMKIDENVQREIMNHRSLRHPNIVKFKEVVLTPTHLAIVMEYAAGGELFERICSSGRFSEDEARFFFQQLISGVSYCHSMQICHRDLKLENTLLDGSIAPRLKICDFGYSKSSVFHSQPKSTVGTPAYIAPEVLARKEYDGKVADVWSCGVTLYVMLVGAYPFEDPAEPKNFRKTLTRILSVQYAVPDFVRVSTECRHLLSRIFVANPELRITIPEIKNHPWFLKNLPIEMTDEYQMNLQMIDMNATSQSLEEIMAIIQEARKPGDGLKLTGQIPGLGSMDLDDIDFDDIDVEDSGDFVCAL